MNNSYCKDCGYLSEDEHNTPFGMWSHTCDKLKIGREPFTWACDKIVVKEEVLDEDAQ